MARFRCNVCEQEFKNRPIIINHALDTVHNVNRCCRLCLRWFNSEIGLAAHNQSPVHVKNVMKTSKPGITYDVNRRCEVCVRSFNNESDFAAHKVSRGHIKKVTKLSASCHSKESLLNERYLLDAVKGPIVKLTRPKPSLAEFRHTPVMQFAVIKRRAVVIDCKVAKAIDGPDELISLCAIDFMTAETLIDSFISPLRRITDWRTKAHGIDAAVIMEAVKHQKNLHGWAAARRELWKHIDDNTILIGQKILFDFEALRLIHTHVVDAGMLAREAVFKKKKKPSRWWRLGELCETFLGVKIRADGICNNLEDVWASREVVLHYLLRPDDFKKRADKAREDFWKPKARSKKLKKSPQKSPKKKRSRKHTTAQSAEQEVSTFDPFEEYDGCYDSLEDDDFYDHHFDQLFQHEQDVCVKLGVDTAYL